MQKFYPEILKGRDSLGRPNRKWKDNIKWVLNK